MFFVLFLGTKRRISASLLCVPCMGKQCTQLQVLIKSVKYKFISECQQKGVLLFFSQRVEVPYTLGLKPGSVSTWQAGYR